MKELQFNYSMKQARLFAIFLIVYETAAYMSNDMIMPGMIQVIRAFKADSSFIARALTVFILGSASLQLFLGPSSDRFGRRPIMLTGVLFFILCNIYISTSHSIASFLWARYFQGMGLCFINVVGYSVLHELFDEMDAVRLISMMSNITCLAPMAGPLAGALALSFFSWQAVFMIIAMISAIAFIGLYFYMPETVNQPKKDGTIIPYRSLSFNNICTNYWALFKNKRFMFGSIGIGLATAPLLAWIGISPIILISAAKLTVMQYALCQIPVFLSIILGSIVMRLISYRKNLYQLAFIGSKIIEIGLFVPVILMSLFHREYGFIIIIIGFCIYGFGLGIASGPLTRLTLFCTPITKGTASALQSIIIVVFTASGIEFAGWIYHHSASASHRNLFFGLFCMTYGFFYYHFISKNFLKTY